MKVNNLKSQKIEGLWIDKCMLQHQQKDKQNMPQSSNKAKIQDIDQNRQNLSQNFTLDITFARRFKGKLFTFNKLGNIQKLEQLQTNSLKASHLFNKIKSNGNSCIKSVFRNRKNFVQINKAKLSSRQSIQTKQTHRQTKSLDASKVSSVSSSNKYRYACDYSEIKEQQIEETIIKNPMKSRTIYLGAKLKNNRENVKKQIKFQTSENTQQEIYSPKKAVRRFFTNLNTQKSQTEVVQLTPNFISLDNSRHVADIQNQIHQFPRLKLKPIQYRMSKRHFTKPTQLNICQANVLPKINFSRKKQTSLVQKERLLTIR